jgi:hypothetical protein
MIAMNAWMRLIGRTMVRLIGAGASLKLTQEMWPKDPKGIHRPISS